MKKNFYSVPLEFNKDIIAIVDENLYPKLEMPLKNIHDAISKGVKIITDEKISLGNSEEGGYQSYNYWLVAGLDVQLFGQIVKMPHDRQNGKDYNFVLFGDREWFHTNMPGFMRDLWDNHISNSSVPSVPLVSTEQGGGQE